MGRRRTKNLQLPERMRLDNGSYYFDAYGPGIKRHWIPLGKDAKQARLAWANLMNDSDTETFGALCDKFISEAIGHVAAGTRVNYTYAAEILRGVFGAMKITEITSQHIAIYLDTHPSKSSANNQVMLMGLMFEKAMRWGWCTTNPCRGLRKNKLKKRDRYIEDGEFIAVRAVASPWLAAAMNIAYVTSWRVSDVLKIRLEDIRDDGLYGRHKKTGKRQVFDWTPALRAVIDDAKAVPRTVRSLVYLLNRRDGQQITPNTVQIAMRAACAAAGVEDFHFHDIRAKAATDAERDGEDYFKMLGHADRKMSDSYVKARKTDRVTSGRGVL